MLKIISMDTKDRYSEILKDMNIAREKVLDKSQIAALYIIFAKEYLWINRKSIFNFKDKDTRENVLKLIRGNGDRALVILAYNLFNNYKDKETDLLNIIKNVNRQDRDIVLNAINIVWT